MNTIKDIGRTVREYECASFFKIEVVNGKKKINRFGFFAEQPDGQFAIYKPDHIMVDIGHDLSTDELGSIDVVSVYDICDFIESIHDEMLEIAWDAITDKTPCGWYYDMCA